MEDPPAVAQVQDSTPMQLVDTSAVKKLYGTAETVTLISADGFEFMLPRDCALQSGTL